MFSFVCMCVCFSYYTWCSAPSSFERKFSKELPLLYKYLQEAPTDKANLKSSTLCTTFLFKRVSRLFSFFILYISNFDLTPIFTFIVWYRDFTNWCMFLKFVFNKICWKDVIHWMWPLFTEDWGTWRATELNLSPLPFTVCPCDHVSINFHIHGIV